MLGDDMMAQDHAIRRLGIAISNVAPGTATASLTVSAEMLNGLGVCHGGVIFTLADAAMAYASNNEFDRAMATGADIDFLAPASEGNSLTAVINTTARVGRSAVNDGTVTDQDGNLIALFRGRTRVTASAESPMGRA